MVRIATQLLFMNPKLQGDHDAEPAADTEHAAAA